MQYLKQDKMNVSNISLLMGSYFCIQDKCELHIRILSQHEKKNNYINGDNIC
jgi:hypothetical protein